MAPGVRVSFWDSESPKGWGCGEEAGPSFLRDPGKQTRQNGGSQSSSILLNPLTVAHSFGSGNGAGTKATIRSSITRDIHCSKQVIHSQDGGYSTSSFRNRGTSGTLPKCSSDCSLKPQPSSCPIQYPRTELESQRKWRLQFSLMTKCWSRVIAKCQSQDRSPRVTYFVT